MLWEIFWRNKNIFSLGFCLSFSLLCILWQRNPFSSQIGYIGRFTDRISGIINSSFDFTNTLWVEIGKYRSLEQRYIQAQKMIEEYRLEKSKFDFLQSQNKYLREALGFKPLRKYPEVRAEVLGIRLNSISPRIIIDKGSKDGLKPLMPVVTRAYDYEQNIVHSVVGLIVMADLDIAVVQPLIHPNFQLGVRIEASREWAILSGNSGRLEEALLTYITTDFLPEQAIVTQSESPLPKNAQVYTSGSGGIFPPGIPIGLISGIGRHKNDFRTAYVKPFVQISEIDYVLVILKEVESWSASWQKQMHWEEYLKTEFGEPKYPKITKKNRTHSTLQRLKKKTRKTRKPQSGQNQLIEEENRSETRRRIRNINQ